MSGMMKLSSSIKNRFTNMIRLNPPQTLAFGFFIMIMIGTLLLMLPMATKDRHTLSFIDALFEATSAICVTGLVVVDTQNTFTLFGQIVLLFLIQVGGLGFMTFSILIAVLLGRNIGLKERIIIHESLNQISMSGLIKLVKFIFIFTLSIEGIGALILGVHWLEDFGWPQSFYYGIFHSISAFNNAGFDLMGDFNSLAAYVGDFTVNFVITLLLIIGGLGFTVVLDVWKKKSIKKLSLHTKLVLLFSFILIVAGALLIFILEYNNEETIGQLSFSDKVLASYFHGTVPRTAGFNTLPNAELEIGSQLTTMFLMFIGGGSGGTAGGLKITTFILLLMAVWTVITGKEDVNLMKRRIPQSLIYKALSITIISLILIFTSVFILSITEQAPLNYILFEVFSAFGTVGMSLGLTPELTILGKVVISMLMFIGRLGPLTIAFALAKGKKNSRVRYPEEKILIG